MHIGWQCLKRAYIYSISLYNLTDEPQYEVFRWLGETLNANFISLDCSEGCGRSIFRRLEKVFPRENLTYCHFAEKVDVDLKLDESGNPEFDKEGQPIYVREYVAEWSVKYLRDLFYDLKLSLPLDYSLDRQINRVVQIITGNRTIYRCLDQNNHRFSSFLCFSLSAWENQFNLKTKQLSAKKFDKSGV